MSCHSFQNDLGMYLLLMCVLQLAIFLARSAGLKSREPLNWVSCSESRSLSIEWPSRFGKNGQIIALARTISRLARFPMPLIWPYTKEIEG